MKNIVLQLGHQNIQFNVDPALHGSTGAPQEMGKNYKITSRTAELLRERNFNVKQTDANANSDTSITGKDWDLYLAVHCDADSASNGGFTDWPEPSTDGATAESQRIANKISDKFFPESGITFRPERRQKSNGIKYYYMWKYLSAKTPCVLIEMGESVDPKDSVILNDTERCAVALARGICNAFNMPYDLPVIQPPATQPNTIPEGMMLIKKEDYNNITAQVKTLQDAIVKQKNDYEGLLAIRDKEVLTKLSVQKTELINKIIEYIRSL